MNAANNLSISRFTLWRNWVSLKTNLLKNPLARDLIHRSGILFRGASPYAVMLSVTDRCQCSCEHCGVATNCAKNELSTNEIFDLIDTLKARHVKILYLFGGEPLLREDLDSIIRYARKQKMRVEMDSNGEFLTVQRVRELKEAGLDLVRISLDSTDPHEHDRSRGRASLFEKVMRSIIYCRQEGLECQISSYMSRAKIDSGEVERMVHLASMAGVRVRLLKPILSGNLIEAENEKLTPEQMERLKSNLGKESAYLEVHWVDDPKKPFLCAAKMKKYLFISASGDVQPCCYLPAKFGNIRTEPLNQIIAKMHASEIFDGDVWECPMAKKEFRDKWCTEQPIAEEDEKCA